MSVQISLTGGRSFDEALDDIARQILMLDANNESLIPRYEAVLTGGLPDKAPPSGNRVIVIGAGIAGMLAGKLLKDAGYEVMILEANPQRVGGRVKTFHPVAGQPAPFQDPDAYAEAGAMRIPAIHPLVNRLIDVLGMTAQKQPFYNEAVAIDDPSTKTYSTWLRCNGIQVRKSDYNAGGLEGDARALGFPLPEELADKTASELFDAALAPLRKMVDASLPIEDQINGWKQFIVDYDDRSMYQFLDQTYKNAAVKQYIGTLENLTSRFFLSLFHSFLDTFFINDTVVYHEIHGGNWRIADALMRPVSGNIVMDARAVEIHRPLGGPITVVTRTEAELNDPLSSATGRSFEGDHVVVAIPFSSMRHVRTTPLMSYGKRRAIDELHYDSSTKILLEFSARFWEWDAATWRKSLPDPYLGHAAIGGGSVTDEPNRYVYFPSHKPSATSTHGVVIASYSWSDDATRWDSLTPAERASYALDGLCQIYGAGIRRFFTGRFQTESWVEDSYACGEAAVFSPGQVMELQANIPTPEGRIHFAGEHTSMKHAWIEGAVESAIRVALEISSDGH